VSITWAGILTPPLTYRTGNTVPLEISEMSVTICISRLVAALTLTSFDAVSERQ
jgi:hypothetical protein